MPWALLISVLIDRAAAGFPLLSEWLKRHKGEVVGAAQMSAGAAPVGAAPAELKAALVAYLTGLVPKIPGFFARKAVEMLIGLIPAVADDVWDRFFQAVRDGVVSPAAPAVTFGSAAPADEFAAFSAALSV